MLIYNLCEMMTRQTCSLLSFSCFDTYPEEFIIKRLFIIFLNNKYLWLKF